MGDRFEDKEKGFVTPGPGNYEVQSQMYNTIGGGKKTFMGENIEKWKKESEIFPGPDAYFKNNVIPKSKSVPGFKIRAPSTMSRKKDEIVKEPVGP